MLHFNSELMYPKLCTVFEMPDSQFVYPIFKNASSTLEIYSVRKIYNAGVNTVTKHLDVYWRDAGPRFNSGVRTYLEHNKLLDKDTIIHLVEHGEIINRHFMPQYLWLQHLYKHYEGVIRILDWKTVPYTRRINESNHSISVIQPTHWIDLDNMIYDRFQGETTVLEEINQYIESKSRVLYKRCIAQD